MMHPSTPQGASLHAAQHATPQAAARAALMMNAVATAMVVAAVALPAQAQPQPQPNMQPQMQPHMQPHMQQAAPQGPMHRSRTVVDVGQREFAANCASCHGMDAKGRGPVAGFLTRNPPDLTVISRQNGGVFPMDRLYKVIDGTEAADDAKAGPHGSREMPIWGRDYRIRDGEYFGDVPYNADAMVRARILSLLEYLSRVQQR